MATMDRPARRRFGNQPVQPGGRGTQEPGRQPPGPGIYEPRAPQQSYRGRGPDDGRAYLHGSGGGYRGAATPEYYDMDPGMQPYSARPRFSDTPMPGRDYSAGGYTPVPQLTKGKDNSNDPYEWWKQDRYFAGSQGQAIDNDITEDTRYRRGLEERYRGPMETAYDDLAQTPGYTPEEAANITRDQELAGLGLTPEEMQSWQLSDDEQASIYGDPNKARGWFDPDRKWGMMNEQADRAHETLAGQDDRVRNAIGGMEKYTRDVISGSQVGNMGDYTSMQDAAIYNPALGLSDEYLRDYRFGPEDQEKMAVGAATSIGHATRARQDDVARAAQASGINAPLALAAGYQDLQVTGDQQAADARLQAEIAAKRLGLDVSQMREGTRLDAVGRQAGMQLDAAGEREGYRQGAQRYLTDAALNNEQNIGGIKSDAERYLGDSRLSTEMDLGRQRQGVQDEITRTGVAIEQGADDRATDRSRFIATNRQDTSMQGQGIRFGQGMQRAGFSSGAHGQVADARRQGQGEYRGWTTGQTDKQADFGQRGRQQRISNYGAQSDAMSGATGGYSQYDLGRRGQGFGTAFKQGLGGAIGSGVGGLVTGGARKRVPSSWGGG